MLVIEGCAHLNACHSALQDIFNLLPNIDAELNRSFAVKSNDMMLVVYVASLIRSILALHNLINNKVCSSIQKRIWTIFDVCKEQKILCC